MATKHPPYLGTYVGMGSWVFTFYWGHTKPEFKERSMG